MGTEGLLLVDPDPVLVFLLLGVLRQVADVPHRGLDLEVLPQELVDRLRLGRRFDDDQLLRHVLPPSRTRVPPAADPVERRYG